ncbi:hypothetical protein FHS16_006044 [Paenibacillus endophyticus]|uniref:Uncharacterized protein n=1 Tax=Paenibacillus endophyticus TaxID=1294268 RepID=A0A7W5CDY2_9BACL|nr:hypothetical protein [Paenibacillus endophyticus]MBB3155928.1 hypothetical protein [Paenibacillus endophyticus]
MQVVDANPESLAQILKIDEDLIKVWSDRSMTLKHDDTHDYKVRRRKLNYGVFIGTIDSYNIYKN